MGLNKREIAVIAETNRDNYSIEISLDQNGLWLIHIHITQPAKTYEAFTSRGVLKTWRNLDDAILYIQETCEDCKTVTIDQGTWKFTKVNHSE